MTTIKLKNGSGAPTAGDLVAGEPALDLTNKRLYTEDSVGTVIEVGTNPGTDVTFADNRKAIFGAGSDLQIYHDGSNSYIDDAGTGNLFVRADSLQLRRADGSQLYLAANTGAEVGLYHAGNAKLATTSTGIDVTGTVVSDGLTVSNAGANADITLTEGSTNTDARIRNSNGILQIGTDINDEFGASEIQLSVDGKEFLTVDRFGDISFYEDTGTTAKLFWDASEERLGIGTSSSDTHLHVQGSSGEIRVQDTGSGGGIISFRDSGTSSIPSIQSSGNNLLVNTGGLERMRIDSSGHLLVGTSSFGYAGVDLTVGSTLDSQNGIAIQTSTTGYGYVLFGDGTGADAYVGQINYKHNDNYMAFNTAGTERMRIDSSGNLLVGQSSSTAPASDDTVGVAISPLGYISTHRTGVSAEFGRNNSDGDIAVFRKDGTTVGSIGAKGGTAYLIGSSKGLRVSGSGVIPITTGGTNSDATYDIGDQAVRFKDLYLSGVGYVDTIYSGLNLTLGADEANDSSAGNSNILFKTDGSEKARLDSSGNFLVGTSTPANSTHTIQKSGASTNSLVVNNSSSSIPYGIQSRFDNANPNDTTSTFYEGYGHNGTSFVKYFEVRSNGGIANYQGNDVNLSDERVKTNIAPLGSMWEKFKAIEVVTFKYREQTHNNDTIGVIAQQVESVAPEFVSNDGFGETPSGEEPLKTIYTTDMYHAAIKALQEAMDRIETLEARITALESN